MKTCGLFYKWNFKYHEGTFTPHPSIKTRGIYNAYILDSNDKELYYKLRETESIR